MPNVLVFKCHENTWQPNHLNTRQMVAVLFSYVLVWYLIGRSSTLDITHRPTIWIPNHLISELQKLPLGFKPRSFGSESRSIEQWAMPLPSVWDTLSLSSLASSNLVFFSSIHWLILGFLHALFVQWSILATIKKDSLIWALKEALYNYNTPLYESAQKQEQNKLMETTFSWLATLLEGVGLLFSKLIIRFESFNFLWCYKCVKLENEVFF